MKRLSKLVCGTLCRKSAPRTAKHNLSGCARTGASKSWDFCLWRVKDVRCEQVSGSKLKVGHCLLVADTFGCLISCPSVCTSNQAHISAQTERSSCLCLPLTRASSKQPQRALQHYFDRFGRFNLNPILSRKEVERALSLPKLASNFVGLSPNATAAPNLPSKQSSH